MACLTEEMKRIASRFEKAVREHEMRGMQDPEDRTQIIVEYEDAKAELYEALSWVP